jgi:monomeric sarcosine oxidase
MRVIIVGAGVVGTMAAWRLAQAGHDVIVCEQFDLDHDRGSSYGDSRIVRRVYTDALYTALMADAYPLWNELQSHFPHEELFSLPGGIFFGPRTHPQIEAAEDALIRSRVEYERLDAASCARRFPAVKLRQDEVALYEPSMGYARASRCVRAAATLAKRHGAQIREHTPVAEIEPGAGGNGLRVLTGTGECLSGERLSTDKVLICAGPWTQRCLAKLGIEVPLNVVRKTYIHLEPARHHENFEASCFPVWIDADSLAYGFPRLGDVPGVKLAMHGGGETTLPGTVERVVLERDRAVLHEYAVKRFPDLSRRVVYEKVCLYTNTPDEDFIIDAVPGLAGAFFIGGLSGHGFKFGPLLGEIALALVTGAAMPYDLSRFSCTRFQCDGAQ